jgi:hypothetical protein
METIMGIQEEVHLLKRILQYFLIEKMYER